MKQNKRMKLKAMGLSLALAALMLPAAGQAQEQQKGLFGQGQEQETETTQPLLRNGLTRNGNYGNYGIGEQPAPLGSGLALMLAAGLGYAALKKKED